MVRISAYLSKLVATSPGDLTKEELLDVLEQVLRHYICKELDTKKIVTHEPDKSDVIEFETNELAKPELASLIASYASIVQEEKQDKIVNKYQRYVLIVTIASVATSVISAIVAFLKR
jgi:hypothetical protein